MGFSFKNNQLYAENIPVAKLVEDYGTPLYVYSQNKLIDNFNAFNHAFGQRKHLVCFAVKANSNLAILNRLAEMGAGFDIVSAGELARVLKVGGEAKKIVFSGVGKTVKEIEMALIVGIRCFNVESEQELRRINQIATKLRRRAPISLRINPDIDAQTHPYISTGLRENKFGIEINEAFDLYQCASILPAIEIVGIDCHIGSQITSLEPFKQSAEKIAILIERLQKQGIYLQHVDFGGGLGISYDGRAVPTIRDYVQTLIQAMQDYPNIEIVIEPGRAICGDAGILVMQVEYLKKQGSKYFAIVNTGMHQMIRPALYQAQMRIQEVNLNLTQPAQHYDIVGPICESSDFLAKNCELRIKQGDFLAMFDAGAYGSVMTSNYNSQLAATEIIVNNQEIKVIKHRPRVDDLWREEVF